MGGLGWGKRWARKGRDDPAALGHETCSGDACSIRCILSTLSHLSYTSLHTVCARQPDFYRRKKKKEQSENTDPEGSREQVNTFNSLFSLYCLLKEFMKMNVIISMVWGYRFCILLSFSIPTFSVACKQDSLCFWCLGFFQGMRGGLHPQFHLRVKRHSLLLTFIILFDLITR